MRRFTRSALTLLTLVTALATPAFAQRTPQPIAPVALDLRAFSVGLGRDVRTADELALEREDLPGRGLGAVGALHVYPLRRGRFALGIGGELLLARGRKTQVDALDVPTGLVVEQRLFSLAPAVSLNFGSRDGWSYVSGGMGPMRFETFTGALAPAEAGPKKLTINMGGGARWFSTSHVAFCFDVRFYLTRPENLTPPYPGRNRQRLVVLSAGISVK